MAENWKVFDYDMSMALSQKPTDKEPLMITENKPEIYDHLKQESRTFVVCYINPKLQEVGVRELFLGRDYDTEYTRNIICPHCGHEDHDSWEHDADEDQLHCGHCGLPFRYLRDVEVSYSTEKLGETP